MTTTCGECSQAIERVDLTRCCVCETAYHLKCVGEDAASKDYGCHECFRRPGNVPRLPRGAASKSVSVDRDEANQEVQSQRSSTKSPSTETVVHHKSAASRTKPGDDLSMKAEEMSGVSGTSSRRDRLMDMVAQNQALLAKLVQAELVNPSTRSRRGTASQKSVDSRINDWVSASSKQTGVKPVPADNITGTGQETRNQVPAVPERQQPCPGPQCVITPAPAVRRDTIAEIFRELQPPPSVPVACREPPSWLERVAKCQTADEFIQLVKEAERSYPNNPHEHKKAPKLLEFGGD